MVALPWQDFVENSLGTRPLVIQKNEIKKLNRNGFQMDGETFVVTCLDRFELLWIEKEFYKINH